MHNKIKITAKSLRRNPLEVTDDKKMAIDLFTPHAICAIFISEPGLEDATVAAILAHLKNGEIRTYNKN